MTLAIPEKVHTIMKRHQEIKWTEVARSAIIQKAQKLEAERSMWKKYAYARWAKEGDDAEDLFDF